MKSYSGIYYKKNAQNHILVIHSQKELIAPAVKMLESILQENAFQPASDAVLVFRELLDNAMEHGNHLRPGLIVQIQISINENKLDFQVLDEGGGFNSESLDLKVPNNPLKLQKRGLILVKALCSKLEFKNFGSLICATILAQKFHPNGS
jgi:anti-sigma regulatory factor (Ser/Thr protein kinase)